MIVGRKREIELLNTAYLSRGSEFVVVYGRRRVGKTYLIREFFKQKKCLLVHATGAHKEKLNSQLKRFVEELSKCFFDGTKLLISSWEEAFKTLHQQIEKRSSQKIVIFLDELPWLATKRSGLLGLIDYYWNHYWSALRNVILVVCGSSASWLIKNIIYNKGGLHNRVTCEIQLKPFNLSETKEYLKYNKVKLTHRHILSLYMALGGIPYYLKYVTSGLTADQNIQNILFDDVSPLRDEFKKLFASLFQSADAYIEIIKIVASNNSGISRSEIALKTTLSTNGGRLSERLKDLCQAGFLVEKLAWNKKIGEYYKLIDEFTLFQLHWVIPRAKKMFPPGYWMTTSQTQSYKSWAGYAFESICFKHMNQVIHALAVQSVHSIDSWRFVSKTWLEEGAQIDLITDRQDDAMTLCEIKFTHEPFSIDKQYAKNLMKKVEIFKAHTKTKKQIFLAMISANGLKPTFYSEELIQHVVTLEDLFK